MCLKNRSFQANNHSSSCSQCSLMNWRRRAGLSLQAFLATFSSFFYGVTTSSSSLCAQSLPGPGRRHGQSEKECKSETVRKWWIQLSGDITDTTAKAAFGGDEARHAFFTEAQTTWHLDGPFLRAAFYLFIFFVPLMAGRKGKSEGACQFCGGRNEWRAAARETKRGHAQPSLNGPILGAIRA